MPNGASQDLAAIAGRTASRGHCAYSIRSAGPSSAVWALLTGGHAQLDFDNLGIERRGDDRAAGYCARQ